MASALALHLHFICMSAVHIIFICFIPFTGTMNSTNWPAPNVWVFMAQLVEHCSAEAMGSNPIEAPKTFFGLNCDCVNRNHNCDDHTFISMIVFYCQHNVTTEEVFHCQMLGPVPQRFAWLFQSQQRKQGTGTYCYHYPYYCYSPYYYSSSWPPTATTSPPTPPTPTPTATNTTTTTTLEDFPISAHSPDQTLCSIHSQCQLTNEWVDCAAQVGECKIQFYRYRQSKTKKSTRLYFCIRGIF